MRITLRGKRWHLQFTSLKRELCDGICDPPTARSKRIRIEHGSGGGGPVTRGTIQTNRIAVFTPDADIVLTGHTHDEWIMPIRRQRISPHGKVFHDEQLHLRAPGYKDAWNDGNGGWEVERMLGPKPIGAMWLRMEWVNNQVYIEALRAK